MVKSSVRYTGHVTHMSETNVYKILVENLIFKITLARPKNKMGRQY